jgi:MoaA/NifB/PqqE/SkfB family radical SAM enzyme
MENNKKFCIRPFNSIHITTSGDMKTCCKIRTNFSKFDGNADFNIKNNSINEFWNSDYQKYLKAKFEQNTLPEECALCITDENKNIRSERQFANQHYKIFGNKPASYYLKHLGKENLNHPEDYNLDITNLCNLKCYMCNGESSSKLLVENNDLGIANLNQSDYEVGGERIDSLIKEIENNKVNIITLQGGEPLMNPKIIKLLHVLSNNSIAKNLSVWITTNGTQYTDKIFQTLQLFKQVKLIFSIDGTGTTNDYLRFPSKWSDIVDNVKKFRTLNNATYQISFTVQNLNILDVHNIIKFSKKQNIHLKLNLLSRPSYLQLHVLPKKTLQEAKITLKDISESDVIHVTNFHEIRQKIINAYENKNAVNDQIKVLKTMIKKRDGYRNIQIKNYLPELAQHLNI